MAFVIPPKYKAETRILPPQTGASVYSEVLSQFGGGVFATEALRVREALKDMPSKAAQFIGYESLQSDAVIKGLWDGTAWVTKATVGQSVGIVLDRSPCYGEAGGQTGDAGTVEGPRGVAEIERTTWVDEVLLHPFLAGQGAGIQHADLGLKDDIPTLDPVRDERGYADAQVDIGAVFQLVGHPQRHQFPGKPPEFFIRAHFPLLLARNHSMVGK